MTPDAERPDACAIGGKVHVFVGGAHKVMSPGAAESFIPKITDAIELAKKQEAKNALHFDTPLPGNASDGSDA